VIHALSSPGQHVSFRDSKLTRLLQPSLSGNAKMSVVCCCTPAERYVEETRSTLQFASRAKLVKTHATVNEILDETAKIKKLTKELNDLKERQGVGGLSADERRGLENEKLELFQQLNSLQQEKEEQKVSSSTLCPPACSPLACCSAFFLLSPFRLCLSLSLCLCLSLSLSLSLYLFLSLIL
jgi:hypothetical protein